MKEDLIITKNGSDITKRWRVLYNYIPASEQEEVKQRWASFKAAMEKTLDDVELEKKASKCENRSNLL